MKRIVSSKLDDIARQEQEYLDKINPLNSKYDQQVANWRQAARDVSSSVEKRVLDAIGDTPLEIQVTANETFPGEGFEVYVRVNDDNRRDHALSWTYKASLSDSGKLRFESNSWSGLKVTTPEQLSDLKESVRVMEVLQNIDWKDVLNVDRSQYDYNKFVDFELGKEIRDLEKSKPNFDDMKKAAQVEELIGTNKIVYVAGLPEEDAPYGQFRGYINLVSESTATYSVILIGQNVVDRAKEGDENSIDYLKRIVNGGGYARRKKKSNVLKAIQIDKIFDVDSLG